MACYKIYFGKEDIRRITLDAPSWDDLVQKLQHLYPSIYHPELCLQYVDDEGDKITVSSQKEYQTMVEVLQGQPLIKLYIKEGVQPYFKDGPPPEPRELYLESKEAQEKTLVEDMKNLSITVPSCLQRLFPGGKILPYNLPSWLEFCTKVKRVDGRSDLVDLDIDINSLFAALYREALARIGPEKQREVIEKSKDFLACMLEIFPGEAIALYNLACAESLLGNLSQAVEALKKAIFEGGYSNLEHMQKDSDLDNIKGLPEYTELILHLTTSKEKVTEEESIKEFVVVEKESKGETEGVKKEVPAEMFTGEQLREESKSEDISTPYPAELKQLTDMGFDAVPCIYLLNLYKGRLERVLKELLRQGRLNV